MRQYQNQNPQPTRQYQQSQPNIQEPVFQPVSTPGRPAPRISDDEWEKLKHIIIREYEARTLNEVRDYMAGVHNFHATSRQFVHRLLSWGVKKYKKSKDGSGGQGPGHTDGLEHEPGMQPTLHPLDHPGPSYSRQGTYNQSPGNQMYPSPSAMLAMDHLPARPAPTGRKRRALPQPGFDSTAPGDGYDSAAEQRPREEPEPEPPSNLSCPFRKRNPKRFNVRIYQTCATHVFPDIIQLKRHVKNFHRPNAARVECPRCRKMFDTADELRAHMLLPVDQICKPELSIPPRNPEDGITPEVEEALNQRKDVEKIKSWEELWRLIFPEDAGVPSPDFEPPIEHFELRDFVQDRFPRLMAAELDAELDFGLPEDELIDKLRETMTRVMDSFQQTRNQSRRQT